MPVLEKGSDATIGNIAKSGATGATVGALGVPLVEGAFGAAIKGGKY